MTDPTSFIGKYYKMDPQLEDLIYGADLENGMEILIENPEIKADLASWTRTDSKSMLEFLEKQSGEFRKQAERWNRWVLVTNLQRSSPASITFIGMFSDGIKQTFVTQAKVGWYVKKASIPVIPTDIQEGLEAKIYEVVKAAMLKQDSALYHGAPFDILEASKALTKRVSGAISEDHMHREILALEHFEEKLENTLRRFAIKSENASSLPGEDRRLMENKILADASNQILEIFGLIPELDEKTKKIIDSYADAEQNYKGPGSKSWRDRQNKDLKPKVDISEYLTDPFVMRISALVRIAIDRHYKLLQKKNIVEESETNEIVKDTTEKILEDVKVEFVAAVEEGYQKSQAKIEERERRFWTGAPSSAPRPGRD